MRRLPATLLEACLVVAAGLGLGLAVNAASDDGLDLGRDHFPRLAAVEPAGGTEPTVLDDPGRGDTAADEDPAADAPPSDEEAAADVPRADPGGAAAPAAVEDPFAPTHVIERLRSHGLQPMTFAEARATFEDPMHEFGAWVFVDAREPEPYAAGHVPGAWLFDRYRPERYLPEMTQLLASCERVVVYCNGGDCDDSEFAADFLRQFGARPDQLWVFVGGIEQWRHEGMPLERGARDSGELVGADAAAPEDGR